MNGVIVLSGPIAVGKSSFGAALERSFEVQRASTRKWILETLQCADERGALQAGGDQLDETTGGEWVADVVERTAAASPEAIILLDSARIAKQVEALRRRFAGKVFHVHLTASRKELERRYRDRSPELKEFATYAEAAQHGTEAQVGGLAALADLVLDAENSLPEELALTAMAAWGHPLSPSEPLVDVIVGAQYGSEGKGNICAHLAKNYDALMRIGGPNAGHRVAEPSYKYVQLPSGTGSNNDALILIGAGSTLWLPQIMLEISDHSLNPDRLAIDPQAMIIDDEDRRLEQKGLQAIATTGQGVGAATARKILNRGEPPSFGPAVRLARDVPELAPFVRETRVELSRLYRTGKRLLLEGTQGTALSIHHGLYPHVTSRETSVSGCLSDAGIAPKRIRRIIMVVRSYPIRVGGPSGWMGQELEWETIAERSGIPVDDLREAEKGTVSNRLRRIAEFDWVQLRRAAELNGATEIAVSFADYFGVENRDANSFAELNQDAQTFIRQVERVTGVPVTMVSKAFAIDGVLDRGDWS